MRFSAYSLANGLSNALSGAPATLAVHRLWPPASTTSLTIFSSSPDEISSGIWKPTSLQYCSRRHRHLSFCESGTLTIAQCWVVERRLPTFSKAIHRYCPMAPWVVLVTEQSRGPDEGNPVLWQKSPGSTP